MKLTPRTIWYLMLVTVILAGCTGTTTPAPTLPAATQIPSPTPIPPTPTPVPTVMNVCVGSEPASLFLYSGSRGQSTWSVLEGLYDGPIDYVQYKYIPVILEKVPSLADGDALLSPVSVRGGMVVVDVDGNLRTMEKGVRYLPAGCQDASCAKEYPGSGDVELDQLVVTYKLKAGITWSDGTSVKAADSVFSFRLAGDAAYTGNKDLIKKTASYHALDELTTEWRGVPGFRDPQYMTHFWIPQPEHVFSGKDFTSIAADPLASQKPIGWGPYLVQEWVAGDHITLAKNPVYFRAAEGLPKVDFVNIRFLNNTAEQSLEALLTGACDVLDESTFLDEQISTILELQQAGKLKAAVKPSAVWEGLYFGIVPSSYDDGFAPNMGDRQDLFGDPRTRAALSMCINRQKIIDDYLGGVSQIPPSYLEAGNPLAESISSPVTYDPDRGAALLDEAGWKDMDKNPLTPRVAVNIPTVFLGTPLQLTYYTTNAELRKQVSVQIASDLAACGVPVDLKYMDADSLFAPGPDGVLFGRKFDLAQFSWVPSTMPACRFYTTGQINTAKNYWFGVNIDGYTSEAFDTACQTASNVLPGQEGYVDAQKTPQELFNTAIPALPLYQLLRIGVTNTNTCGYGMDSTSRSSLWNLENMDSSPGCVSE